VYVTLCSTFRSCAPEGGGVTLDFVSGVERSGSRVLRAGMGFTLTVDLFCFVGVEVSVFLLVLGLAPAGGFFETVFLCCTFSFLSSLSLLPLSWRDEEGAEEPVCLIRDVVLPALWCDKEGAGETLRLLREAVLPTLVGEGSADRGLRLVKDLCLCWPDPKSITHEESSFF